MNETQDANRIPDESPYTMTSEELDVFRKSLDALPPFPPIVEPIKSIKFGIPKFGIPYPDHSCLSYICGYMDILIEFTSGLQRQARISLTEKNALFPYYTAMSWQGVYIDVFDALSGTTGFGEIPKIS